ADGPAKVTSGTFCVLYLLRNAKWEDMLIAPIMKHFYTSQGLHFNRDIKPPLDYLHCYHDQLVITVIQCLGLYVKGFEHLASNPLLQHIPRRPIPLGYVSHHTPARASIIEEATTRGNLLFHDEVYVNQLRRTPESLSKYTIPGFHDQLTNARIRAAQLLRKKDLNAWERREIFQLGFGLFHLCLNLVWGVLHVHRGSVNELGSLTYFFALIEKARLGGDQPDYHTLLAALTQIAHGLLLNAWLKECGFASLPLFAESKPSPDTLRKLAARILTEYATPMPAPSEGPESENESTDSDSGSEHESSTAPKTARPAPVQPTEDIAHHNVRLLTRDILMVLVLVRAISDGDIGRVEVLLPHLAMMFRGSGCNKYCTEILHFIHNLKHVWTPEFADIMRDNMIVCISGRGPGHCMAIDMNIEHLIGYLKILLQAKGMNSTWDCLGNISAAIVHLQRVKKKIAAALNAAYQSTGHTTPDTAHLVWRVQRRANSEDLQLFNAARSNNPRGKLTSDILLIGEGKIKSSTLATFNKKLAAWIDGRGFEDEEDECPAIN
ncbi:hypothetical protein C8R46DRAFT_856486, partial [Mycena filopes]